MRFAYDTKSETKEENDLSILSGLEIKKRLGTDIYISDFNESRLNPNSYNLRLHNELLVYTDPVLDMKKDNPTKRLIIPEEGLVLEPGVLYLGRTVERTATKNLVPMLEGRSSIGRLGLAIHITAGFGDVYFGVREGESMNVSNENQGATWTLEIVANQPIRIYPFVEVCQIYYHEIIGEYERYNSGKYQGQIDIQSSKLYQDFLAIRNKWWNRSF